MKRREDYTSSGPRISVRFFGGFDFKADDAQSDLVSIGYAKGVPMGGDLKKTPEGKKPSFLFAAMKDPDGANLDRYQIVKGWLDDETPRWTAYDSVKYDVKMDNVVTMIIQERPVSSPIWYNP